MACCAAPVRRRRARAGGAAAAPSHLYGRGSLAPSATEGSLQQQAYGLVLQTICEGSEPSSLSPVQLEVQRDLRLELQSPAARLQPGRKSELLGRPRSPPALPPRSRRGATTPPRAVGTAADRWGHPTKDLSSSTESSESSDSEEEEEEEGGEPAAQFARRLREQHFDPSTIFTAFDTHGTGVISVEDFKDGLAR